MNRDWEFPERLSLMLPNGYGSMGNMLLIKEQLIHHYCFPKFEIEGGGFALKLTFGKDYSPIKKEWVLDVYDYYRSAGVWITHD